MGAFVQDRNNVIYPNSEALYAAIERCMSNDNASLLWPDGSITMNASGGTFAYAFRGLGLVAFPSPEIFMAVGNVFCARDTSGQGAGDYLLPLNFMPQLGQGNLSGLPYQMMWLRAANCSVRAQFNQNLSYYVYPRSNPRIIAGRSQKSYQASSILAYTANAQSSMPIVAPLVGGDLPASGGPLGFNYDTALNIFGTDKLISHTFVRGYYGINTLVTQPYTQAEMAANITP